MKTTTKSKFPRVLLFILSMAPFFVILGLMSMNIPICLDGDAEFIGWIQLWKNTRVGLCIIAVSIVVELIIYWLFHCVCTKESGEDSEQVVEIKNRNFELVSFVTSIFLPLISFQYDQLSHWIVTALIVFIIGYIFCTSNGYYTNPTLALFHYRLYDVKLDNLRQGRQNSKRDITILAKCELHKDDRIRCVRLTDEISYATKY